MQKFIHCADIHLGSKMESKLPREKAKKRRSEVRETFRKMVEFAKQEGVRAILLAGDVFDSDSGKIDYREDRDTFYNAIRKNPEIDFLYLRGNHDEDEICLQEGLENLKTFSGEWMGYNYDDVYICGLEMAKENAQSLYSTLRLEKDKKNIVMLHGEGGSTADLYKVHLGSLAGKHIDYLALGHIHSYSKKKLDNRGECVQCGCLEGRGFDETGEKGFVLLEIDDEVKSTFIPFAKRTIEKCTVDISDTNDTDDVIKKILHEVAFNMDNFYRIELIGDISYEAESLAEEVEDALSDKCYFVSVKNKTLRKIDISKYQDGTGVRDEFVRKVMSRNDIDERRKHEIILLGLRALEGQGVDV